MKSTKTRISSITYIVPMIYFVAFIRFPYFEYYDIVKYLLVTIIAFFLLIKTKALFTKSFRLSNQVLLIYLLVVVVTSLLNSNHELSRNVFLASVMFSTIVLEVFLVFQYFIKIDQYSRLIDILYKLTFGSLLINDLLLLTIPSLHKITGGYYFVGNKFDVVYLHLILLVFFLMRRRNIRVQSNNSKIIGVAIILATYLISYRVDSATGLIGITLLMVLLKLRISTKQILTRPLLPIIVLVSSSSFFFIFDSILSVPFVRLFIEETLHRDVTLTGRLWIYRSVFDIMPGHFFTGFGHGSTFEICMKLLRAPNTQNGLIEILVQYGVLGVILFLALLYTIFRGRKIPENSLPLVTLIYVFILLSSVEITFSLQFFALIALLLPLSRSRVN